MLLKITYILIIVLLIIQFPVGLNNFLILKVHRMAVNNEHNPFCIAISYDYDKIKCKNKSNEKNNDPRNDKTINEIAYDTQHSEKTTDLHTVYGTSTKKNKQ